MTAGIRTGQPADMSPVSDRQWVRLCAAGDVPEDEGRRITTVPPVAAFKQGQEFFCIDDACSHEDYSLAQGWAEDCVVECPLHYARFSLRTGAALAPPASAPVAAHPTAVVGGELYAALPASYLIREGDGHGPA